MHVWVLEGAFRKWMPTTAQPLYFFRDALIVGGFALAVLVAAPRLRRSPPLTGVTWALAIFLVVQAIAGVTGPALFVAGARSYLAPLLFALFALTYADGEFIRRASRTLILYSLLEVPLALVQAQSPGSALVNQQVGGEDAYFVNFGVVRASGTFSAPLGFVMFLSLAAAAAGYLLLASNVRAERRFAGIGLGLAIAGGALSGSRSALIYLAILVAAVVWRAVLVGGRRERRALGVLMAGALLAVATVLTVARPVLDSFAMRVDDASRSEDVAGRLVRQGTSFASSVESVLGDGAGTHSQVGIALGSVHEWTEIETQKWALELGALGWLAALIVFAGSLALLSTWFMRARTIPAAAYSYGAVLFPTLIVGQITQNPSTQGFIGIAAAVLLIDLRDNRDRGEHVVEGTGAGTAPVTRGRR
ncbi:hypothetical protein [Demequina sp. NBRC 110052]|uniref:hypothetical protein n=1 Tax=Demequina sp. NBRC 110052 TaxID=1570341 RepID=UPI00117CC377|nr:hypothetical protein [Demequina sp. NBRC 110052]